MKEVKEGNKKKKECISFKSMFNLVKIIQAPQIDGQYLQSRQVMNTTNTIH